MSNYGEKLIDYSLRDGISPRYLKLKQDGLIKDIGALKSKPQASEALAQGQNLFLQGKTGIGKSFLAFELAFDFKCKTNGYGRFYYNRASVLYGEYKGAYSNIAKIIDIVFKKESFFYDTPPSSCKFVIIDEIDDLQDWTILNEVIISAYDKIVPIIIIGNLTADEFATKISGKAFSRFNEKSLILEMGGDDLRGK